MIEQKRKKHGTSSDLLHESKETKQEFTITTFTKCAKHFNDGESWMIRGLTILTLSLEEKMSFYRNERNKTTNHYGAHRVHV